MPSPSRLPRTRINQYNLHYSPVPPLRAPLFRYQGGDHGATPPRRRQGFGTDGRLAANQRWTPLDMNDPCRRAGQGL
jgi:hypothetical protein